MYIHELKATKELKLITFDNHEDAKKKLVSDGVIENDIPKDNDKNMAKLVKDHSDEDGIDGYRYKQDLVRQQPEVIVHNTDNVSPSKRHEFTVSNWRNERKVVSRTISLNRNVLYIQKTEDTKEPGILEKR